MHARDRRFRVGLLVIGAGILFIGMLMFILGSAVNREKVSYFILFEENVKGMVVGSRVNYQGVPIGQVEDIRFQDGFTHVTLAVDPTKAVIQEVTRARLDRLLVTGQITVELEGWRRDAEELPPGSLIQPKEDPLHEFTRTLPEVVDDLTGVARKTDRLLENLVAITDAIQPARVERILASLERATLGLDDGIDGTLAGVRALVADARGGVATLEGVAERYRALADGGALEQTFVGARDALRRLEGLEHEVRGLVGDLRGTVGGLRGPLASVLRRVGDTLVEVRGLARALRLAPSSLLYGRAVDDPSVAPPPPGGPR